VNGALTAPPAPARSAERDRLFAPDTLEPHGRTLEDEVIASWRELRRGESAPCLVCGSALDSAGRCDACGSELS
jgi:tRNA(Ile2) C34 agmatinyltransferase TiaS